MPFSGKVAFITGAGSGMGRLAAQRLAAASVSVAAVDVNEAGLAETAKQNSERIKTWTLDVTDHAAVLRVVDEVEKKLGPIDRVMNAAAIMPTELIMAQDVATMHRCMNINYGGTINVTMAIMPRLLERGRGDLINFASMAGWIPLPHFGAYNASKFAVVAFTEVLAHENRGRGIRFACVCPPPVATPLLDQARSQPRVLKVGKPIAPGVVLDAIERDLDAGELMVFPTSQSKQGVWVRRYMPQLLWSQLHKLERLP